MSERAPRDSPMDQSRQTPALQALEHYPVAAIAVADDGAVLFANTAFAKLLGCSCAAVTSMSYAYVCSTLPAGETLFAVARLCPDTIGRSLQFGQATCFVKMHKSAVLNGVESVATAMFGGLAERLSGVPRHWQVRRLHGRGELAPSHRAALDVRSPTVFGSLMSNGAKRSR
jgi:hypothetical protein